MHTWFCFDMSADLFKEKDRKRSWSGVERLIVLAKNIMIRKVVIVKEIER